MSLQRFLATFLAGLLVGFAIAMPGASAGSSLDISSTNVAQTNFFQQTSRSDRGSSGNPQQKSDRSSRSKSKLDNLPACASTDCNCSDFRTQQQAQRVLESFPAIPTASMVIKTALLAKVCHKIKFRGFALDRFMENGT